MMHEIFCALTHWGRVTHICISKITIIGSDNGLSPGRRHAIIWTNVGILLIRPLGTNFSEILIKIYTFSFKKMHLKMSSGKWRPFCLGLNVLRPNHQLKMHLPMCHVITQSENNHVHTCCYGFLVINPCHAGKLSVKFSHHHVCWCPEDLYHKNISSHDIGKLPTFRKCCAFHI